MVQLSETFRGESFITDLGGAITATVDGEKKRLNRYAVFAPCRDGEHHQPVEVGSSLKRLQKKYGIPDERVCRMAEEGEE